MLPGYKPAPATLVESALEIVDAALQEEVENDCAEGTSLLSS